MKAMFCMAPLLLMTFCNLLGVEAKGLVIYSEPPSTYAESCEYVFLDTAKPLYYTVVRTDGRRIQLNNNVIMTNVDYPPLNSEADIQALADNNLSKIRLLLTQYPQFKSRLRAAQSKWENALAVAQQMAFKPELGIVKIALDYEGTHYDSVQLSSLDGGQVSITHSAGVRKLELDKLSRNQILALNTTSTTIHIDPNWKAASQRKIDEEKQATEYAKEIKLAEAEHEKMVRDASMKDSSYGNYEMSEYKKQQLRKIHSPEYRVEMLQTLDTPENKYMTESMKEQIVDKAIRIGESAAKTLTDEQIREAGGL
jgi:hypothetical protein